MFEITLVKEIFAIVAHPPGGFVDPRECERRVFVCGSLMEPKFLANLLGHEAAMAPALARGHIRGWGETDGKKFHFLRADPGGTVHGVVLLGLSDADMEKLEQFERVPEVRRRADIEAAIGDVALPAVTYLAKD